MLKNIIIAGKNKIACNFLKYINYNYLNYNLFSIPNNDDNGIDGWQPSFKKLSLDHKIKIINLKDSYLIDNSIFISCEFNKIINPDLFNHNNLFNIHFSKLPEYKGMYTSTLPILHNKKISGVTLHKIDQGIDTGDIIDQIVFNISKNNTAYNLYEKYNKYGLILLKKNINNLINNNFKTIKQSSENSSYYSKKSLNFNNIQIDYNKTANEIKNQIHGFSFIYYQLPEFNKIKIINAEILDTKNTKKPKSIIIETINYIIISTIDYDIKLNKFIC
tara:strand:- start:627 stop:1451 length:825 start_codon:yes stop_codon:yes gene_type:complete